MRTTADVRAGGRAALMVALVSALAGCGTVQPVQTPSDPGMPPGPAVSLTADGIAFDTAELRVPANTPFTIVFVNRDSAPHDVAIEPLAGAGGGSLFEGAVFGGPATRWFAVPELAPGEYTFRCTVHPNMNGRVIAS